ncbi:MAG TPA: glycosyltransferase family 2 protein [Steroidobacteraceae bacterium]|jgi:glycosyltransferase involved in cell wall biosynthesis
MRIAVLVPCFNEEVAIQHVVRDFQSALPSARVYVYDNNSNDKTVAAATAAGAIVRSEPRQGKGNVIRRMFSDIDADIYLLVDGDNTYEAAAAPKMIEALVNGSLDMVVGRRVEAGELAYRPGHRFGNSLLTGVVAMIFGSCTQDMLSGYRVFSRRFVKSFPALSHGFEIETELTVHALELRMPTLDVDTQYVGRLPGSQSKLNTVRDGIRIFRMIGALVKEERPLQFFGLSSVVLAIASLVLIYPVFMEYLRTGLVPRFPTAILSTAIMTVALLAFFAGLILDTVTHGRREMKRLTYLGYNGVTVALENSGGAGASSGQSAS